MSGQELTEVRQIKAELGAFARELAERYGAVTASAVAGEGPSDGGLTPSDAVRSPTLSLGLAPSDDGGYALAVRYRLGLPAARAVVKRVAAEAGAHADVRRTGRIRSLATVRQRPPVAGAQALVRRERPLRPGVSVAHVAVTAGTLGAFVTGADDAGTERFVLSNWHVLVGSPDAAAGDVVVQPGPADGGRAPRDRIGTLARWAPMAAGEHHLVDCALALLDDEIEVDPAYPVGRVTTTAQVLGGESVAKLGRTTALTQGRVSAIELDDVLVGYGDDLGVLGFDGQIEVESTGDGPFSRGGDSGSLVYREDGVAVGLLFAGSETGGPDGTGLTYVNPIDTVLSSLAVTLL
ncbi:S1 family peptidase [Xylanimonas protaetiae]|nr:S1 family peptidase [Xylanimonas protaetiae]